MKFQRIAVSPGARMSLNRSRRPCAEKPASSRGLHYPPSTIHDPLSFRLCFEVQSQKLELGRRVGGSAARELFALALRKPEGLSL